MAADGDVANLTRLLKEGAAIDLPSTRDGEEGQYNIVRDKTFTFSINI